MPIRFGCPKCKTWHDTPDESGGMLFSCSCGQSSSIPNIPPNVPPSPLVPIPLMPTPATIPKMARVPVLKRAWPWHRWSKPVKWGVASAAGLVLLGVAFFVVIGPRDASSLHNSYARNPSGFRAANDGRRVMVTGRVVGSTHSLGETVIQLGTNQPGYFFVRFASPGDAARASRCSTIIVVGTVGARDGGTIFLNSSSLLLDY